MRIFQAAFGSAALLLLASLTAAIAEVPSYDRVRVLESIATIDDVELTDHEGKPFQISQLRGRVALILFGFTNCPDVCPMTMELFRQFRYSDSIDPDLLAFVLISVDGDRDTPSVMKEYVAQFSYDFIGVTGEPAKVQALADQFSVAFFRREDAHSHYTVAHSPQAFVLDTMGRLRAELYSPSIEAMSGVVQALLAE